MNELKRDFASEREMTQAERDQVLHQMPEWRKVVDEFSSQSMCFRTKPRLSKYSEIHKIAAKHSIDVRVILRWYRPEMTDLAFKVMLSETLRHLGRRGA